MHRCVRESHTRSGRAAVLPRCCPAGKLATLKGTVTRMSHVRPLMADMGFTCTKCGCSLKVEFPDGRFAPPTSCGGEAVTNCGSLPGNACCSMGLCVHPTRRAASSWCASEWVPLCVLDLRLCASCAPVLLQVRAAGAAPSSQTLPVHAA